MLELSGQLGNRAASGLTADAKQKISLGRGLVREDVSAVLFDEPLTVIDPHLKWQLRRKLKQIHHELKLTLIYVTHDQVEALTFADQVVVMTRGRVGADRHVRQDLFERPAHTFVGYFIGSPGHELSAGTLGRRGRQRSEASASWRPARVRSPAVSADAWRSPGIRGARRVRDAWGVACHRDAGARTSAPYWLVTARVGGGADEIA